MSKTKLRIMQDFVDFNNNKPDGIYLDINKENIFKNYALIVGPNNTPYFGGYYLFEVIFPKNYPNSSPSVKLLTIDGKTRINPNLYECGKVCLSILGTWEGPGWKKVMNLRTVLLSIQSLLHEFPIQNEPGYEKTTSDDQMSIDYNHYILFQNYRLSILEVLISVNSYKPKIKNLDNFKNDILEEFKKNYQQLNDNLKSYQITIGIKELKNTIYFLQDGIILDFLELNNNFDLFCNKLKKIDLNSI
jgi:ubiquitin-protein ligase